MHEPKVDLSCLDPSRNEERWAQRINSVAERAFVGYQRRLTVGYQLLIWSRPVLAVAAAVTLIFGAKVLLDRDSPKVLGSSHYQHAYAVVNWANAEQRPEIANVIRVLGESNDSQ